MSLDLSKTVAQIDGMALDLRARQSDREARVRRALRAAHEFSLDDGPPREPGEEAQDWPVARVLDAPDSRHAPPALPADFCVAAVDGSHIDVDRHLPVRCFLINCGVSVLTYGSRPEAELFNRPRLYARDEELVIRDITSYREQAIEGAVLGAKRTVEEIRTLVEVVRELPGSTPTLALLDGSLVMLGLVGPLNQDFVLRELVEEGFVGALDDLREMAVGRTLAVASYISLPGSAEVVGALRRMVCTYGDSNAAYRCRPRGPGRQPCDQCVGGVLDRDVYSRLLEPGERSAIFATSSLAVARYYGGNDVHFFYVNVGEEIGRVEVPSWVAEDEGSLGLVHSLVVDQCRRGDGYPVGLMEAHEQAVVGGADRRLFVQMVEQALYAQGQPVYTSEKARSKRLRRL
jgi:GNAT superfamily N-acetyltransferase